MEVRALPPELMASSPAATPAPRPTSGPGCLVALILLPIVLIAGLVVGTALSRPDDPNDEASVTLDEGTLDGTRWRVDAERDVEGDECVFLYEGDEQVTGACSLTPQDATFGERTVVFGRASSDATEVVVLLNTGDRVDIDTVAAKGIDGRFYVQVVEGDVDADGLAP